MCLFFSYQLRSTICKFIIDISLFYEILEKFKKIYFMFVANAPSSVKAKVCPAAKIRTLAGNLSLSKSAVPVGPDISSATSQTYNGPILPCAFVTIKSWKLQKQIVWFTKLKKSRNARIEMRDDRLCFDQHQTVGADGFQVEHMLQECGICKCSTRLRNIAFIAV